LPYEPQAHLWLKPPLTNANTLHFILFLLHDTPMKKMSWMIEIGLKKHLVCDNNCCNALRASPFIFVSKFAFGNEKWPLSKMKMQTHEQLALIILHNF
jgi:hypothetical protein